MKSNLIACVWVTEPQRLGEVCEGVRFLGDFLYLAAPADVRVRQPKCAMLEGTK